jgi:hypothetical protein
VRYQGNGRRTHLRRGAKQAKQHESDTTNHIDRVA